MYLQEFGTKKIEKNYAFKPGVCHNRLCYNWFWLLSQISKKNFFFIGTSHDVSQKMLGSHWNLKVRSFYTNKKETILFLKQSSFFEFEGNKVVSNCLFLVDVDKYNSSKRKE